MRLLERLRTLMRDKSGNALVICAATLPLLIGSAAIGVDTIQSSVARRQLQRAADSAAIAGVYARVDSEDVDLAANRDLALNNDITLSTPAVIENSPTAGNFTADANAVRVILTAERSTPFISFFTGEPMTIQVEATATRFPAARDCMLALEDTNTTGITFTGNATISLGCGAATNSTGGVAVEATGSATVSVSPISARGTVPSSTRYASGVQRVSSAPLQEDPYADIANPTVPANCQTSGWSQSPNELPAPAFVASSTGVYCYRGMSFKGTVVMPSNSTYIVDGGILEFTAQANVTCSNCTFVLTSRTPTNNTTFAQLDMNGGAALNITAPDTGTYAGVVFYQDRRTAFGTTTINGGANMTMRGGMYFPNRLLVFSGNSGSNTACVQIVARQIRITGSTTITNTCPANSASQAFGGNRVRLVA